MAHVDAGEMAPVVPKQIQIFFKTYNGKLFTLYVDIFSKVYVIQALLDKLGELGGPPGWLKIKYNNRSLEPEQTIYEITKDDREKKFNICMELTGLFEPIEPLLDKWLTNYGVHTDIIINRNGYLDPSSENFFFPLFDFTKKLKECFYPKKSRMRAKFLVSYFVYNKTYILPIEIWYKNILPYCISPSEDINGRITRHSTIY